MEIRHMKFDEIGSTQTWLKENVSKHLGANLLVSTALQTDGVGRMGNTWAQYGKSIAFSLSLRPADPVTFTPLELGVHLVEFFKAKGITLSLKWPNDLLIHEADGLKKVGGILCHYHSKEVLIVGIGINIDPKALPSQSTFKFKPGALSLESNEELFHSIPRALYEYILENRLNADETQTLWNQACCHYKSKVKIVDDNKETEGLFIGLGSNGEAIISTHNGDKKLISGSLWILD